MEKRYVLLLFFDLPVLTAGQRRAYRLFRKQLIRSGYLCFQESVYLKLLRGVSYVPEELRRLETIAPEEGSVAVLRLSLQKLGDLRTIRGTPFDLATFGDDLIFI